MSIFRKPLIYEKAEDDPKVILAELAATRIGYDIARKHPEHIGDYIVAVDKLLGMVQEGNKIDVIQTTIDVLLKLAQKKFSADPLLPMEIATVAKLIGLKFGDVAIPDAFKLDMVRLVADAFKKGVEYAK